MITIMEKPKKYIGSLSQKKILQLYSKYVNAAKVWTFKGFGLGIIPSEWEGIKIKTLEGSREEKPPIELYNYRIMNLKKMKVST